ncbi:hypothetical protein [Thiohalocapsa sp. ML1]|uniref:hypothetical protein n=1 Tax=Thiohalocapsa sp. ML1 TaxID=1431688 RepID=UPI0007321B76|nr:hypothetical protein [Thiohalocapsa sp. ML1]
MPNARLNAHAVAEHLRTLTHLAMPVRDWEVEVGPDATDDLAVWVWLTVDDEDFDDTARRRQVQEQVFEEVRDTYADADPWVYVRFRTTSEMTA